MRLDIELVVRRLVTSRTEAQELIAKGGVLVNGIVCTKSSKNVQGSDVLVVTEKRQFVSRGGEKLLGAFTEVYRESPRLEGKQVLDVGSSTGGFTDCVLQLGASHVDAVDVGTDQLHASLRSNPHVSLFENTDIRTFASAKHYDLIVADLSFISIDQVLEKILSFCATGTELFILIKPQFEVGKGNTKKGIVKDEELVEDILLRYKQVIQQTMQDVRVVPCVLKGGDGNQEYFLYGRK